MRDLKPYAERCLKKIDALKIRRAKDIQFKINTRAKTRLGVCKKTGQSYLIEIASALLDERVPESELENTLLHEILHTCRGCMKHTGKWKQLADKVNAAYGCNISRTASKDALPEELAHKPRYKVVCPNCGAVYERYKRSALIQHPERYRCGKCGGRLDARC